jgi:hypothetical protein
VPGVPALPGEPPAPVFDGDAVEPHAARATAAASATRRDPDLTRCFDMTLSR